MSDDYPPPRISVERIINPRSIAVIGASEDKRKFGGRLIHNVITGGFSKPIYPINPKRREIFGLPVFASIAETPTAVDLAVCVVPIALSEKTITACAESGVGACVVITAGFGEIDEAGRQHQQKLVDIARRHGMRLIGPNCLGLLNTHAKLILNSSPSMQVTPIRPGGIAHLTQSGALMATVYNRGVNDGAAFSTCVSLGNQADLELADFLDFFANDPNTQVVTLYVEGFRNPSRFLSAARRCRTAGKPIMMLKAGMTTSGANVTKSHTASLSTDATVLKAVCEREGIVLLDDMHTLIHAASVYARFGPAKGDGICVITGSGGAAALSADRMNAMNLRLATFNEQTREQLEKIYEPTQLGNPMDIGALRDKSFIDVDDGGLRIAARDPDVNAVLSPITTAPMIGKFTNHLCDTIEDINMPMISVVIQGTADDGAREILKSRNLPCYETLDEALRVLKAWQQTATVTLPTAERPAHLPAPFDVSAFAASQLDEAQSKQWVNHYGLDVTRGQNVKNLATAKRVAAEIGYPVALKAVSPSVIHKTDVGGVQLNLSSETELEKAWHQIMDIEGHAISQAYVCEMVKADTEMILGIHMDAEFGPMVLFGMGGVTAELLGDVVLLPAPVTPDEVLDGLKSLRLAPLLNGYRGRPKVNLERLAHDVEMLSWLAMDAATVLQTLDLNPVMLSATRVVAVDARATLKSVDHH